MSVAEAFQNGYLDSATVIDTRDCGTHLFAIQLDGLWGYIDRRGNIVVKPQYQTTFGFSDGLAAVGVDGFGVAYINKKGSTVIPPGVIPHMNTFAYGRVAVSYTMGSTGRSGFSNRSGKLAVPLMYFNALRFSDGLARVQRVSDHRFGFINPDGRVRVSFDYQAAGDFSEGMASVLRGRYWNFIDKTGKVVLDYGYDSARNFSEGLAGVQIGNQWGFIDKTGKIVIKPRFDDVGDFSAGLAAVEDGFYWGFINRSGRIVVTPRYPGVEAFSDGRALVSQIAFGDTGPALTPNGNVGFIDVGGQLVIPLEFDRAQSFVCGLAQVSVVDQRKMRRYGYVDTHGRYVWRPSN